MSDDAATCFGPARITTAAASRCCKGYAPKPSEECWIREMQQRENCRDAILPSNGSRTLVGAPVGPPPRSCSRSDAAARSTTWSTPFAAVCLLARGVAKLRRACSVVPMGGNRATVCAGSVSERRSRRRRIAHCTCSPLDTGSDVVVPACSCCARGAGFGGRMKIVEDSVRAGLVCGDRP